MTESNSHRRLKNEGKGCESEVPISGNRRLDKSCDDRVTEIEKSGRRDRIQDAISRLNTQDTKKELLVPNKDLDKAKEEAEKLGGDILIQNLSKTRRRFT